MKSQRRHDLEKNELADWLAKKIQIVKPYQNAILGAGLLLVVAMVAYLWWFGQAAGKADEGWDEFYRALAKSEPRPTDFEAVIERYPDTDVAHWARLTAGDLRLAIGCNTLFLDKSVANEELREAVDHYLKVREETPSWLDAVRLLTQRLAAKPWYVKQPIRVLVLAAALGVLIGAFALGGYLARKVGTPDHGPNFSLVLVSLAGVLIVVVAVTLPQLLGAMGIDTTPPRFPTLQERATFGLARALEAQGNLDQAEKRYQEVDQKWHDGAYAVAARRRLEDLKRASTRALYDKFAKFDPRPAFLDEPGVPGERPSFDWENLGDPPPVERDSPLIDLEEKGVDEDQPPDAPAPSSETETTDAKATDTGATEADADDAKATDTGATETDADDAKATDTGATEADATDTGATEADTAETDATDTDATEPTDPAEAPPPAK